jgi:hypothetical protein
MGAAIYLFFFLALPFSGKFLPMQLLCCLHRCKVLCLQALHLLFLLLPLEPSVRIGAAQTDKTYL